jgi:hypothetical protein
VFLYPKASARPLLEYSKAMPPLTMPLDCGAKIVVRVMLWFGLSVSGGTSPLMLNPVPDTIARKIVRLSFPVLFSTTDCDVVLPSGTLPKFTEEGLAVSCAVAVAANRKILKKTNPQPTRIHGE